MKYLIVGDSAISIEFGNEINSQINDKIKNLNYVIKKAKVDGIIETVPSFKSLLVYYDPVKLYFREVKEILINLEKEVENIDVINKRIIEIPVCYDEEFGSDIRYVMEHTKLSYEELVSIHTNQEYLIYMLGFLPGFAYLGGMDKKLVTPRLDNPRIKINAGSIGIGGEQTGIYPIESPGGWRIIGRTPIKPYDINRKNPVIYEVGDYIRFIAINKNEYYRISDLLQKGSYEYRVIERSGENWGY
ncbi:MAG: 5-oxoprolinase subunit PxpB [Peptostreptococcaceae bacterium]